MILTHVVGANKTRMYFEKNLSRPTVSVKVVQTEWERLTKTEKETEISFDLPLAHMIDLRDMLNAMIDTDQSRH